MEKVVFYDPKQKEYFYDLLKGERANKIRFKSGKTKKSIKAYRNGARVRLQIIWDQSFKLNWYQILFYKLGFNV